MPNDDTQLLALGAQLQKITDEWLAKMAADNTINAAHDAKVEALTGIPTHDAPPYDENKPYWTIRSATPFNLPDPELEKWTDIHKHLFPLCERILAMRAHTLEGLRDQATAITLSAAELWDPGFHDDSHERMFIECVCQFLGITPVRLRNKT
jgi:hypothetical protein